MSKLALLGLIILFGAVFLIIPENNNPPTYALFRFAKRLDNGELPTISAQSYVYYIFGHFQLMALSYIVAAEARIYRLSCRWFFYLQVADFFDYLATYNRVWFHVGALPISMNLFVFTSFIFVAMWDYHRESLSMRL
jgi:hypothetical protein